MANGKPPNMTTPGGLLGEGLEGLAAGNTEPETPLKKRRGSGDTDVKSPGPVANASAARGLGFGQATPPITAMTAGFGSGKMEFGGLLGGGMEMEEEIL